jgi:hypothetical protein
VASPTAALLQRRLCVHKDQLISSVNCGGWPKPVPEAAFAVPSGSACLCAVRSSCEPLGCAISYAFVDGWWMSPLQPRRVAYLWGLTFELSGSQRQGARPRAVKMYTVPLPGAWWPAVGAPLERGVRPHVAKPAQGRPCWLALSSMTPTRHDTARATLSSGHRPWPGDGPTWFGLELSLRQRGGDRTLCSHSLSARPHRSPVMSWCCFREGQEGGPMAMLASSEPPRGRKSRASTDGCQESRRLIGQLGFRGA